MVDITPLLKKGSHLINSYGAGGFIISNQKFEGSALILPSGVHSWNVKDISGINIESFAEVIKEANDIEILLLGTGKTMQFIDDKIVREIKRSKITVDMMDTGAACRTYNVLLAEERKVAAALIAV